jgi:hypothetical protein
MENPLSWCNIRKTINNSFWQDNAELIAKDLSNAGYLLKSIEEVVPIINQALLDNKESIRIGICGVSGVTMIYRKLIDFGALKTITSD